MPAKQQKLRRYIIMSNEGYLNASLTAATFKPNSGMVNVMARAAAVTPAPQMKVLDSLHENGPKLVEMPPKANSACASACPD